MKRFAVAMTVLAFAGTALANEVSASAQTAVMADTELDGVAAGHGWRHGNHHGWGHHDKMGHQDELGGKVTAPRVTNNINISPIIVTQTSVALTQQNAVAKGGNVTQNATTTALNLASINYSVKF